MIFLGILRAFVYLPVVAVMDVSHPVEASRTIVSKLRLQTILRFRFRSAFKLTIMNCLSHTLEKNENY